ncbi:MAG: RraA family protein [Chloroflexota bacterium]
MVFNSPENVAALTPLNPYDRLPDGRPRVPDDLIQRMRLVTPEEAWSVLQRRHGYSFQFEGNWINLHPDRVLVGRAVTAQFVPHRPDLDGVINRWGEERGKVPRQNTWVIDSLIKDDVVVVDLFGKVRDGTFAGDNLATAIKTRTGTGMVVDGGIRDVQQIHELDDFNAFVRGLDPTAIADVTLAGVNIPIRIGGATVLPGDVVLGTRTGVTFIPPHLALEIVEHSELTRLRDEFGKLRLAEGVYTSGQIDTQTWEPAIQADFERWRARA